MEMGEVYFNFESRRMKIFFDFFFFKFNLGEEAEEGLIIKPK